jgi:tRNA pseudouridine13 synthase
MTGHSGALPGWRRSLGDPQVSAVIRAQPEDFHVLEIPLVEPSGEGVHLWLELEKRSANTNWVAEQLAAASGVALRDVGFAGMKDRHAVTSQWFSVSLQEASNSDWTSWSIPDVKIIQAIHHPRKLKRGALKGNRFRIVLRELSGDITGLEQRLDVIRAQGVPNYFGPQRFGFNGANIERGIHWLRHGGRLSRSKRSIYISAVRSFLFNQLLSRRVADTSWNRILDGDIAMLDGSRSLFTCDMPDTELSRRCEDFDIHPTGPLPGNEGMGPVRQAGKLENEALKEYANIVETLQKAGARADRRALRLSAGKLQWDLSDEVLTLSFELSAGGYATSLLSELVSWSESNHIPES